MNFFGFLYRYGLWISVPAFGVSAALLVFFIISVVRVVRQSHILSVPLLEQQEIEFPEAGRVVLCIEGPLLTTRFGNLDYDLRVAEGMPVEGRTTWFHAKTSSLSKVRMELKSYELPRRGRYILSIKGLGPGSKPDSENKIVFMKPHLAVSILYVIGITLSAVLLIGSLVLFLLRLTGQGTTG
jgi:hypothetical protein